MYMPSKMAFDQALFVEKYAPRGDVETKIPEAATV
jgi:hypothetical protein